MIKLKSLLEGVEDLASKIEDYFIKYNDADGIKNTYQDYLENGSITIPSTISEAEGFVVFAYTADNTLFTKEPYRTGLLNVLKKLPKYSGYVYGAHDLKPTEGRITLNYILSTTTDESLIQNSDFHYGSGDRTLYKIKVQSGASIEDVSLYGDQESEVLLLPGTSLKKVGREGDYVVLEQI